MLYSPVYGLLYICTRSTWKIYIYCCCCMECSVNVSWILSMGYFVQLFCIADFLSSFETRAGFEISNYNYGCIIPLHFLIHIHLILLYVLGGLMFNHFDCYVMSLSLSNFPTLKSTYLIINKSTHTFL